MESGDFCWHKLARDGRLRLLGTGSAQSREFHSMN